MTHRSDIEQALDRYLAEGGEQVPDRVVDAALDQIDHTSQRHALRVPWRFLTMPYFLKSAMVGAAVVAVLIVGGVLLTGGPSNIGEDPAATSSPSASTPASASASPLASSSVTLMDTSDWVAFTSTFYAYQLAHPPTWTATAAANMRGPGTDDGPDGSTDSFRFEDAIFYAYADEVASDTSENEWIFGNLEGCSPRFEDALSVSFDGHPGKNACTGQLR